ncbi:Kelch-like protein 17 [Pseudonocardiaceae bacterium YIM PH 21723]|nr:Kelch-like protein 17 [Pseudonocardiaceae bacterium YIM PH 21723]
MTEGTAPMSTAILAAPPEYATAVSWYGQHDAAVVLSGGKKVLFAGGADADGASVRQSAVFDLDAGTWSTAQLGTARQLHALTLLPSGKVLITGGISGPNTAALTTAEVYDPTENTWTAVEKPMAQGRWGHSATLLSTGLVLVAGGSAIRSPGTVMGLSSAELFNPGDLTWAKAEDMTDARTGHAAVAVQDGKKVLVCGGSSPVGTAVHPDLAFCEVYDADAKTWKPTGSMRYPRSAHTATALSATKVLAAGGRAPGAPGDGSFDPYARATAEVFDLAGANGVGSWSDTDAMASGRAYHRAVALGSGIVLVLGGTDELTDEAGYRGVLRYEAGRWTKATGLDEGRWAFGAAASGTKVLVVAGIARTGLASAEQKTELTRSVERSDR